MQELSNIYTFSEERLKDITVEKTFPTLNGSSGKTYIGLREESLKKPLNEYFPGYTNSTLPALIPPNESVSIYIDIVVLPTFLFKAKLRLADISVGADVLIHFTNHENITLSNSFDNSASCSFNGVNVADYSDM